jgi:hypothetical protein
MDKIKYLESPLGMFELTKEVFLRYYEDASAADFILLIFFLYHLREQIVEGQDYKEIKATLPSGRTDGQKLFFKLWEMVPFQIIRELCNGTKHHKIDKQLRKVEGFTCDLSRCGDQLGQTYYLIDGEDSRDIFSAVFDEYRKFFDETAANHGVKRIVPESGSS